jgi:hypothetical protein
MKKIKYYELLNRKPVFKSQTVELSKDIEKSPDFTPYLYLYVSFDIMTD